MSFSTSGSGSHNRSREPKFHVSGVRGLPEGERNRGAAVAFVLQASF
jgi:hypothetical protein